MKIKETKNEKIVEVMSNYFQQYNNKMTEDIEYTSGKINFIATTDEEVIGLLQAEYCWHWLFIKNLIVIEKYRNIGVGTKLLQETEQFAKSKNCHSIWFDTFSFQAPQFYIKKGYKIFGELKNYPKHHTRYFFYKNL